MGPHLPNPLNQYSVFGNHTWHFSFRAQIIFIRDVIDEERHLYIASNKALRENIFTMIICIENRIPLFVVGKPGTSKSLSKSMVFDAMKGYSSKNDFFKRMKQARTSQSLSKE